MVPYKLKKFCKLNIKGNSYKIYWYACKIMNIGINKIHANNQHILNMKREISKLKKYENIKNDTSN